MKSNDNWYNKLISNIIDIVDFIRNSQEIENSGLGNEYNNVIGIEGDRGYGKSSLLADVYSQLEENSDLLIDPITPDEFRTSDSFYSVVLVKLKMKIDYLLKQYSNNPKVIKELNLVNENLIKHQLDQARSSWTFIENLKNSGTRGDDFAWQYTESQNRKVTDRWNFSILIEQILKAKKIINSLNGVSSKANKPLLVIPVDDCDTSPELIPRFIDELENITRSKEVVILVTFSSDAMKRALSFKFLHPIKSVVDKMIEAKITDTDKIQSEINDLYNKIFPSSHRLILPGWTEVGERLLYTSKKNNKYSILKLLEKVDTKGIINVNNLSYLFNLNNFIDSDECLITTYYSKMLPKSGRSLNNIHETLNIYINANSANKNLPQYKFRELIRMLCNSIVSDLSIAESKLYQQRVTWNSRNQFQINFSDLSFGDKHRYTRLMSEKNNFDKKSLKFPIIDSFNPTNLVNSLNEFEQEEFNRILLLPMRNTRILVKYKYEEGKQMELSSEISSLFLFLLHFKNTELHDLTVGDFELNGSMFYEGVEINIDSTDDGGDLNFFLMPAFDNILPYNIYFSIWDDWVNELYTEIKLFEEKHSSEEFDQLSKEAYLSDLLGLLHLFLIVQIYLNKKVDPIEINGIVEDSKKMSLLKEKLKENILINLDAIFNDKVKSREITSNNDLKSNLPPILMHLCNNLGFTEDFTSWIRTKIMSNYKTALRPNSGYEYQFEKYFDYCINLSNKSISKFLFLEFCKSMQILDNKTFKKVYPIKLKKYVNRVRLFQPRLKSLLEQLVEQKLLTSKDVLDLADEGLTKKITTKLELLNPESAQFVISQLGELLSTESDKLSSKIDKKKDLYE